MNSFVPPVFQDSTNGPLVASAGAVPVTAAILTQLTAQYQAVATDLGDLSSTVGGALTAVAVRKWAPNTVYAAGDMRVSPGGDIVTAIAAHTSGTTYNAANWALPATFETKAALDADVAGYTSASSSSTLTALRGLYGVPLSSFYQTADAGDYGLTLTRALAYATPLKVPVLVTAMYQIKSTVALNTGDQIVGFGPETGFVCPIDAPIKAFDTTSKDSIILDNFYIDGGVRTTATTSIRVASFTSCTNITAHNMTVQFSSDWGLNFNLCSNVRVTNYTNMSNGGGSAVGGRDGIHFLDCHDVVLDGAKLWTGDDCVGVTSQTRDIYNITIRNVVGYSTGAAVLTCANEATSAFAAHDINISGISSYQPEGVTAYVATIVRVLAQNSALYKRIKISDISGTSSGNSVAVTGTSISTQVTDVAISNINVTAQAGIGLFLDNVTNFTVCDVLTTSNTGTWDGVTIYNGTFGTLTNVVVHFAAYWGIQLNGCDKIDLYGCIAKDCGQPQFVNSSCGGMVIANSTNTSVQGGSFWGATSYYGISIDAASTATTTVSATTRHLTQPGTPSSALAKNQVGAQGITVANGGAFTLTLPPTSVGRITIWGTSGGGWHSIWTGSFVSTATAVNLGLDGSAYVDNGQVVASVAGSNTATTLTVTAVATGSGTTFNWWAEYFPTG